MFSKVMEYSLKKNGFKLNGAYYQKFEREIEYRCYSTKTNTFLIAIDENGRRNNELAQKEMNKLERTIAKLYD